jgi:hypothetical protein
MADAFKVTIPIAKIDVERREITGWASVSLDAAGRAVVDSQGDHIPLDELEEAAHEAFARSEGRATAGDMHRRIGVGDIIESIMVTPEKRAAMPELFVPSGPSGWLVTMKIHDDATWADIKSGKKLELSIAGMAERVNE